MATEYVPRIGDWYRTATGEDFEIVAIDEEDQTIEIQYFDGTIEELDPETWLDLGLTPIEAPEDWSGSLDIEREDYGIDLERTEDPWHSPLDALD